MTRTWFSAATFGLVMLGSATVAQTATAAPLTTVDSVWGSWGLLAATTGDVTTNFKLAFDFGYTEKTGTEFKGEVYLGNLHITNIRSPLTSVDSKGTLTFASDMWLSNDHKANWDYIDRYFTTTDFEYVATLNSSDPLLSADGLYIASLGVSAAILEDATASFRVYGSINSPLSLTSIEVINPAYGFVTKDARYLPTVVPGPIAGAGLPALMALGGFVAWRRRKAAVAA